MFKNQEDLLIEFSQFLPDANNSNNASNSKLGQNQSTNIDLFNNFNNASVYTQNSILNVPIPTVLTSNIMASNPSKTSNNLISSTIAKQQLKVPVLAQPTFSTNALSSPSSSSTTSTSSSNNKIKSNSENINQQQSHQTTNNSNSNNNQQNSLTCKTNTSAASTDSNNMISSVKRSSTYQTIPNKKQKLISHINSSNNNLKTSKPNNSSNLVSSNVEISLKKYNGTINEITFFERVKKALRNQQIYDNFLKCLALFNQDIVTHTELISIVEPFLSKFANLYKWFKDYVETKSINNLNTRNPNDLLSNNISSSPKHNISDQMSSNSTKNRLYMPPGANYSLQIDYLACKQYGASYRDISSYPQPISTGQTELCKQVN